MIEEYFKNKKILPYGEFRLKLMTEAFGII